MACQLASNKVYSDRIGDGIGSENRTSFSNRLRRSALDWFGAGLPQRDFFLFSPPSNGKIAHSVGRKVMGSKSRLFGLFGINFSLIVGL